ncbi:heme exporter protein CcmD [Aureimonas jatrophae]|uniref:Heme exporter protein D n=1 Tax=Aureimonas jatrophae TaxID=1166073 RepID=A0A1H0BY15_9HYPH|nr:heme exporter protein CcmD [Aureimonas jatrophae]MBB3948981.1 heme exporter protein CcmD [Aureimonas jatrophae]SDN50466.1 heme exporter protein CcmD [Aureimonas jatrophae]
MSASYVWFVGAAYGMSALAIGALALWIAVDAVRTRRRLASLDAERGRP